MAGENAALAEVERAGQHPGGHHAGEQEDDGSTHEHTEVDACRLFRMLGAVMRDQRVGDQRHRFVEQEQREHVAGQRNALGGKDGAGKAHEKAGLVLFVVAAHVTDGIQRTDDPQSGSDERKERAQRLDDELEGHARQHFGEHQLGSRAAHHVAHQRQHLSEQGHRNGECDAFTHIGRTATQGHQQHPEERRGENAGQLHGGAHCPAPSIDSAARRAMAPLQLASSPK